jgi:hypothetical protein
VNGYILDNLDPGLAECEDEALVEAGDIVDQVLDLAYRRTRADLNEIHEAISVGARQIWSGQEPPEPTRQAWFDTWPATFNLHQQERYEGTAGEPEREHKAGPCRCDALDVPCPVHEPWMYAEGIPVDD